MLDWGDVKLGGIAVLNQGHVASELDDWLIETYRWATALTPKPLKPRGNQIARQRNLAVEHMLNAGWEWLLFVDSDCVPSSTALPALLGREADVVAGVVLERFSPFAVAATREADGAKITLHDVPCDGLLPVRTVGSACTLVRRRVFERLDRPWYRCGQVNPEFLTEDTEFCLRARDVGFRIALDCSVRVGHAVSGVLWPGRDGRRYIQWHGVISTPEALPEEVHS